MSIKETRDPDLYDRVSSQRRRLGLSKLIPTLLFAFGLAIPAAASTAYGSLNNFDCVNDTGVEAHGFEIELDYGRSTAITYTYDYNHYGTPKISEDLTDPAHPKVFVRYASTKKPDGTWAAYTAIPSGPIAPTQGHQFTDPSVNFGGEHFGVGFIGAPTAVKYHWLLDDGAGNLVYGPDVYISTPTFTYYPPVAAQPARVIPAVVLPPPVVAPVYQFGKASWVKDIKTTTHNPRKIKLRELVGDDPGVAPPWANGEPAEVETEWRILQTEFAAGDGGKNHELQGLPEDMPNGNEVITRRYEFFKYIGPIDAETGEAMADVVAADGKHGQGTVTYADHFDFATGEWVTVTKDLSKIIVVGDFVGAQMAGFDVAPNLGLIDHIQDADVAVAFPPRVVVVGGGSPFFAIIKSGTLPPGMEFDQVTGVLSGTPTTAGSYTFTVEASDTGGALISQSYTMKVVGDAPPVGTIGTSSYPVGSGNTSGGGVYEIGTSVTVNTTTKLGYVFLNWTDAGVVVSTATSYTFTVDGDHSLVANFAKIRTVTTSSSPIDWGTTTGGGTYKTGDVVTVTATPNAGYAFDMWTGALGKVSGLATYTFTLGGNRDLVAHFVPLYSVSVQVNPSGGGTTVGGGTVKQGQLMRVKAFSTAGYRFVNWTEGGVVVATTAAYTFSVFSNHSLVANFVKK